MDLLLKFRRSLAFSGCPISPQGADRLREKPVFQHHGEGQGEVKSKLPPPAPHLYHENRDGSFLPRAARPGQGAGKCPKKSYKVLLFFAPAILPSSSDNRCRGRFNGIVAMGHCK